MGVSMRALHLFDQLGITYVPINRQHRPGPKETTCVAVVDRMIRQHGARHTELVLRTVADHGILVADVIDAVSDLAISHPRWARSADWFSAFAGIDVAGIRQTAKAANIRPRRVAIATLIAVELAKILGPSRLPKTIKQKLPPKPPRALARVAGVEANVQLGRQLLALRAEHPGKRDYGRAKRARFNVDVMHAVECVRVARAYGERPEIYRRLFWQGLVELSSPTMPAPVRRVLEVRILAGERIGAPQIRRARKAHADRQAGAPSRKVGKMSHQPARPKERIAA